METQVLQDLLGDEPEVKVPREQYVVFSLGEVECAAPIANVQQIERVLDITRVPGTPAWVEGIANLRCNIVTIVDLRAFTGVARLTPTRASRIIVSKAGKALMGLLVDKVVEIRYLWPSEIQPPVAYLHPELAPYLQGVYSVDDRTLLILDVYKTLHCDKMCDLGSGS